MDAVIYLRVSTKEQAAKDETSEGYSIPAQREACLRHIAERGWSLAGEFTDAGESALSADRPMLKAMLRRIAEGEIGAVVVHKIDRLARSMQDHVAIRAALRQRGGAAGLGDREHRRDGLGTARGEHPRTHGRVLLGQPGLGPDGKNRPARAGRGTTWVVGMRSRLVPAPRSVLDASQQGFCWWRVSSPPTAPGNRAIRP